MACSPGADQRLQGDRHLTAERDRPARVLGGLVTAVFVTDGVIGLCEVVAAEARDPAALLERIDAATLARQPGRAVENRAMPALRLTPGRDA